MNKLLINTAKLETLGKCVLGLIEVGFVLGNWQPKIRFNLIPNPLQQRDDSDYVASKKLKKLKL